MADRNYYEILGVKKDASEDDIRKSYRKLARKYHPDVNANDKAAEKKFKEISEAYAVLSDKKKRAEYDQFGSNPFAGAGGAGAGAGFGRGGAGPFGFDPSQFRGAGGAGRRGSANFADIFSEFFAGGGQNIPQKGADIEAEATIDFRDAILGTTLQLTAPRQKECSTCGGTGNLNNRVCPTCHGSGVIMERQGARVKVPAGVGDGQKIRLRGQGSPGSGGGPAGDLLVTVRVRPHKFFERKGDDIHIELPVTVGEALLGAEVDVPTIHGTTRARIPAGTQSGQTFRIKGKGVQRKESSGDHYYRVQIVVPKVLSDEARAAVETIEQAYEANPRASLDASI